MPNDSGVVTFAIVIYATVLALFAWIVHMIRKKPGS
jgi:hypothetical protein